MDSTTLQSRIYKGYGKAALRIGPINTVYRASSAISSQGNTVTTLNASFNAEDMKYGRPNKYGKPTWFGLFDGTLVDVGDYLIGPQGTFFVAAMQLTLPILMVECNRTINILRPQQQTGIGQVGYGGDTDANETILMQGWPASVLQGTKGEKTEIGLPGDVRTPWWAILLPSFSGVVLRSADIITDELSRRYVISSAELTDAGWRLTAMQAQT
ncbi:hypothetical protein [Glaciimonas sp. PCH181]|uniref:hypothetical protein n=1 Tax=Glaciimonas sp. PCH181 TaxID=2133943 RepID=UPI000D3DC2A0|nr:hypothetical protein [Glaciimonas sp. PCH181]PUA19584.1 hypothetical protein C7W93_06990 [Glaciimonas sp. PCH181]